MPNHFLSKHTPEALLGRNDSKNPATTCKGITSSGRPCRRALATRKPLSSRYGVVAVVEEDGVLAEATFYCWQHKDQATATAERNATTSGREPKKRRSIEIVPLQKRTSIDTLVQRLGIDAISEEGNNGQGDKKRRPAHIPKPPQRTETRDFAIPQPSSGHDLQGQKYGAGSPQKRSDKQSRNRRPGFWDGLCCMAGDEDDRIEIVRHRKRVESQHYGEPPQTVPMPMRQTTPFDRRGSPVTANGYPVSTLPIRPAMQRRSTSNPQTARYMSLLPAHLSPVTTSALLAELIRPANPNEEEGYIYIFWLTPQDQSGPGEATARSLLAPPELRPQHARRISEVMTEFSYSEPAADRRSPHNNDDNNNNIRSPRSPTIKLKIGRASNVTRRMNEWQRQCGYALTLVRWYPYVASSPHPSPSREPRSTVRYPDLSRPSTGQTRRASESAPIVRKVPMVKRVERLVHLELAEKQVKHQCVACGKEHREWFAVEASQAGIRLVDECVRRWVGWAEQEAAAAAAAAAAMG